MSIEIEFDATDAVKKLEEYAKKLEVTTGDALEAICNDEIFNESFKRTPLYQQKNPKDRKGGNLRSSRRIERINRRLETEVVMGYYADYAAYVHEMPETNRWSTPGTGPKFLSGPLEEAIPRLPALLAEFIKELGS